MNSDFNSEKGVNKQHGVNTDVERPTTAVTETTKSEEHYEGSIHEPIDNVVTLGESIGNIETRSTRQVQSRVHSRASSTHSRPLSIVPRSKRRGILGSLTITPEVENPYDYKKSTKWGLTFIVALATAAAPLGSTIFYREYSM